MAERRETTFRTDHLKFLSDLPLHVQFGDYFFVHAGIDPDEGLEDQDPRDLMWIRQRFLDDERDHGAVIVHGHTPVRRLEVKSNRIGIDTAAVFGGRLSCIVLEGSSKAQLTPDGPAPMV